MRLSLLDRSRTRIGADGAALRHSVQRAVHAESLGYDRFWAAEHHAVPGIASGAPAVLLAAVGAQTTSIRLGSAGVMLPHHQPVVVAEQFLMLEELYPGRIDLGVGRTLGFTDAVRRALRQESADVDQFEGDIRELQSYLTRTAPVTARPVTADAPPLYLLATGQGVALAAKLGLPVIIGGPVLHSPELRERLATYRRDFQPCAASAQPSVLISFDLFIADTEDRARELALPELWSMARSRETGEFAPLESVPSIRAQQWSPQTRRRVDQGLARTIAGPPEAVRPRVHRLLEASGADEVVVSTSTYDPDDLAELDARTAELVQPLAQNGTSA